MRVAAIHLPYRVIRDEVSLYHFTKGPSFSAIHQNLDQKIQPYGFVVREFKKPEMTIDRLVEVVDDDNCSFPVISVRTEYFKDQRVNYKKKGDSEWDHAVIVLEVDMRKQEMTIFDPMEKRLSIGTSMGTLRRRLPLAVMVGHWERAIMDPRWAFWVERKRGQMKLKVD
ncbi:MAG: hypothetical protein ABIE25_00075 [Thermoplasmatota archaeon]